MTPSSPFARFRFGGLAFVAAALTLLGAWGLTRIANAIATWEPPKRETPGFILSSVLPVSPSQIELACANKATDITGCVALNLNARPAVAEGWAKATVEERLACHDPYPMPLRVNLVLLLRECFEGTGVLKR